MLIWLGAIIPVLNGLGRVAVRVHLGQFYRRGIYATMAHRLTGSRSLYMTAAVCDSLCLLLYVTTAHRLTGSRYLSLGSARDPSGQASGPDAPFYAMLSKLVLLEQGTLNPTPGTLHPKR